MTPELTTAIARLRAWAATDAATGGSYHTAGAVDDATSLCDACEQQAKEIARLAVRLTEVIGIVQRKLQPGGSPPPGDERLLINWICDTARKRAECAEALARELERELEAKWKHAGACARIQANTFRTFVEPPECDCGKAAFFARPDVRALREPKP